MKTKLRYDVTIVPDLGGVWNEIDAQGLLKTREHGKIRYHQQKRNRKWRYDCLRITVRTRMSQSLFINNYLEYDLWIPGAVNTTQQIE